MARSAYFGDLAFRIGLRTLGVGLRDLGFYEKPLDFSRRARMHLDRVESTEAASGLDLYRNTVFRSDT